MEQVLLIGAVIVLYTMQALFSRTYNDHYPQDKNYAPVVFTVVCGAAVSVVTLIFSGFSFGPFRWDTLALGLANAIVLCVYHEAIIKASASGAYSIVMVFNIGGGIIIPSVISMLFFGSPFSYVQLTAIAIIFVAVYLVSFKKTEGTNDSAKGSGAATFLFFCFLVAISNGAYGTLLNWQEAAYTGNVAGVVNLDKQLMVLYTFLFASVISLVRLFIKKGKGTLALFRQSRLSLLYLILASAVSAIAVNILVILISVVNITALYTFNNAGVMLLSVFASAIFFKERLTRVNVVGCVLMTVGLILMGGAESIELFIKTGSFT